MFSKLDWSLNQKMYRFKVYWSDRWLNYNQTCDILLTQFTNPIISSNYSRLVQKVNGSRGGTGPTRPLIDVGPSPLLVASKLIFSLNQLLH